MTIRSIRSAITEFPSIRNPAFIFWLPIILIENRNYLYVHGSPLAILQADVWYLHRACPKTFSTKFDVTRYYCFKFSFIGHAHLTDFNIATVLEDTYLATSMSGTKPYIAPEIFDCAVDLCVGYSYPVDWWSLGRITELLK